MTDIVERLRYLREHELRDYEDTMAAYKDAADEIERLRAALTEIANSEDFITGSDKSNLVVAITIARETLKEETR